MKIIGFKLKRIREMSGMSQTEMSDFLKMSQGGYSDLERGESDPKLSTLQKIADSLNIKLEELFSTCEKLSINIDRGKNNQYVVQSYDSQYHSPENEQIKSELTLANQKIEHLEEKIIMMSSQINDYRELLELKGK